MFLALLGLFPVACGGLGESPHRSDAGTGFGPGVVGDYANAYLPLVCQYDVRCHLAASVEACRPNLAAWWRRTVALLQSDLDTGRVRYNPNRAATCMDAIQSAPCPSESNGQYPWGLTCGGVFPANVATGDACLWDFECEGGHCRYPLTDTCTGSCCPGSCAVPGDVGASCVTEVDHECVDADYCKPSYQGYRVEVTCQPRLAQGDTCDDPWDYPCQRGLTCELNGSHTCVPYAKDGQPCDAYSGPYCDNWDSFCDSDRGTCQARRAIGAPCADDSACVTYAQCRNGICTLTPGAGDSCTVPDGGNPNLVCLWSTTQCIDGICQEPVLPPLCTIAMAPTQDAGVMPQVGP